jgi:nucleoside-diphosphate-sugar epimerase
MMQDKPQKTVLIVGCGYIGQRVAALLPASRFDVTGVVRSDASRERLATAGVRAVCLDLDRLEAGIDWECRFADVFYFAPPPTAGLQDLRIRAFLDSLQGKMSVRRIVYISTSAVYGDCQGAWITEAQPINPATPRGHRRQDAEQQLLAWCEAQATQWIILRVPGIYGPGKLPLERLREGKPVLQEADSPYTNRIHADDLAAICVAAMHSSAGNSVYNVSDGHPSNMTDYFFRVADAAGLPRPPVVSREEAATVLSPGMLSFLQDSRRMDNSKLLQELKVELQYPDLDAGLASCFSRGDMYADS